MYPYFCGFIDHYYLFVTKYYSILLILFVFVTFHTAQGFLLALSIMSPSRAQRGHRLLLESNLGWPYVKKAPYSVLSL